MGLLTLSSFYLVFFLVGLGYAVIAVLMGQLLGGHDTDAGSDVAGHEAGGHEAGGHDFDHDFDHDAAIDAGADAGGDMDVDHDVGGDHEAPGDHDLGDIDAGDGMPTISPLSPVTLATFATSFGGVGLILDKAHMPALVSFPVAGASGFVIATGVFYLFYKVFSITQSTSSVAERHTINRRADVITPIPAGGIGEIAYVLGGRRFNAPARSEDGEEVGSGTAVVIVRKAGTIFVVKRAAED